MLYQSASDASGIANALSGLGIVQARLGDFEGANRHLQQSLERFRELDDPSMISLVTFVLAYIALLQGERASATSLADESLRIAQELDDEWNILYALMLQGYLALDDDRQREALTLLRESLTMSLQLDDLRAVAYTVEGMAAVHASQGRVEAAWFAGVAASIREQSGHALPMVEAAWHERYLALARGQFDDETWNVAWAAGQAVSHSQAMQRALGLGETVESDGAVPEPSLAAPPVPPLSPRELDVLRLLVDGRSNQEIAGLLFISHRTVASHVESILNKLDLESRTAAATWAVRNGLA